ncbi:ABC transporter substrate-binding protein [Photobacterium sagamiensis]|uniref:ABC transporter substrate-binding protein n=1 Tax=Photobacterium sagamiensis TaxID=2910241 RepID=UPI003D12281A
MFRVSLQLSCRVVCCLLALTGSMFSTDLLAVQNIEKNRTILTLVPEHKDQIIANFNPYSKASMPTTHEFIFEPLIVFNSLQNNQPEYRLATDYQFDDDLSGISFSLREGVTWSDGKPFTADDVVFSFFLAKKHPELDSHGINQLLGSVQKRSPTEIYFKLNKPNALAAYTLVLFPIVPKHQWQNVSDPVHFANASPIGTGPFTQIEKMDENGYLQCQNPSYWQADARKIDCLRYPKVTNNDDFIARIAKGEFDWTGSFIPDIERHYASYSPDFKYWLPPASTISLMFNFKAADPGLRAVISKVEFRRAISMAVRRQRLIDIAAFGQGVPSRLASGMSQRFNRWADPVVTEKYLPYMSFNPELATDWLTYINVTDKNGDQWRDLPSGEPLELTILTPRGWSDFNITALLLTEMMQEIGINVRTIEVEYSEFVERLAAGDYVTALTNYPQGPTPFKYFDMAFNSAYQAPQYPRYAMHFYRNDRIDALLDQFPIASSARKRLAILHELNDIVASQQITVPLYNTVQFYQYNTQRFTGWFNENNPRANPLVWPQTPERLLHVLALRPKK